MDWIDQGTILSAVRSDKYPSLRCYGIIITARCDIANDKVSKLYFLIAADVKTWVCTAPIYRQIYKGKIRAEREKFLMAMQKCELNGEILLNFPREEAIMMIQSAVNDPQICAKAEQMYREIAALDYAHMTDNERCAYILQNKKPVIDFLKNINKGDIIHYLYLPQDTYLENGVTDEGLIVDLQEIESIAMQDMKSVKLPNINYLLFSSYEKELRERLAKRFWLEDRADFVKVVGTITSPWREYLMQRFSFSFSRIGVDAPGPDDFDRLLNKLEIQGETT